MSSPPFPMSSTPGSLNIFPKITSQGRTSLFNTPISRTLAKNIGKDGITVHITDNITPGLIEADIVLEEASKAAATLWGAEITKQIQKEYEDGQTRWKPASHKWIQHKARKGYDLRTMHAHDNHPGEMRLGNVPIAHSVRDLKVVSAYNPTTQKVDMWGLQEGFQHSPHVWIHELHGLKTKTKKIWRPFIFRGLAKGMNTGMAATHGAHALTAYAMSNPQSPPIRINSDMPSPRAQMESQALSIRGSGRFNWLFWFLPPSKLLAYLGIFSEIQGILSGGLLSSAGASQFARNWSVGLAGAQVGIPATRKTVRRRFRRKLWGPMR